MSQLSFFSNFLLLCIFFYSMQASILMLTAHYILVMRDWKMIKYATFMHLDATLEVLSCHKHGKLGIYLVKYSWGLTFRRALMMYKIYHIYNFIMQIKLFVHTFKRLNDSFIDSLSVWMQITGSALANHQEKSLE